MKVELSQVQKMLEWFKTKLYLDAMAPNAKTRSVRRGQVYRCNFGCGIVSEMQKDRPAVIIQNNIGNRHSGNTIVVPITHDESTLPCMAAIEPQKDSLGNILLDGQANASNLVCISKARLGDFICSLPASDMKLIDEAIAKTLDLMDYYAKLSQKLDDKLVYITRLKQERNHAQDELAILRKTLHLPSEESLLNYIINLQKVVDTYHKNDII